MAQAAKAPDRVEHLECDARRAAAEPVSAALHDAAADDLPRLPAPGGLRSHRRHRARASSRSCSRRSSDEVRRINQGREKSGGVLSRLIAQAEAPPIEVPPAGWDVQVNADRNGTLQPGELGIDSMLPAAAAARIRRPRDDADREVGAERDRPQQHDDRDHAAGRRRRPRHPSTTCASAPR